MMQPSDTTHAIDGLTQVLLTLITTAGAVFTAWFASRAKSAKTDAQAAEVQAKDHAENAGKIVRSLSPGAMPPSTSSPPSLEPGPREGG